MIAVIFEVEMKPGRAQEYFDLGASLRPELERMDDFVSVSRFASLRSSGQSEIFARYRIRVAEVLRDCGTGAA